MSIYKLSNHIIKKIEKDTGMSIDEITNSNLDEIHKKIEKKIGHKLEFAVPSVITEECVFGERTLFYNQYGFPQETKNQHPIKKYFKHLLSYLFHQP